MVKPFRIKHNTNKPINSNKVEEDEIVMDAVKEIAVSNSILHNLITVNITNTTVEALLDTGATCSLLNFDFFIKMKQHPSMKLDEISAEGVQIRTADKEIIKVKGSLITNIWLSEQYINAKLYVIKGCPYTLILEQKFLNCFEEIILNYQDKYVN